MLKEQDAHKYCVACKGMLVARENHKLCSDCGRHYYFNPRPCATLILVNEKDEMLLVRRAIEPFKDWWDIPGGFLDENESLEDAAHREIKEETNLTVDSLKYITSFPGDYEFDGELKPLVIAVFEGRISDVKVIRLDHENSEYKFVAKADIDIDTIAFESQQKFLKSYLA